MENRTKEITKCKLKSLLYLAHFVFDLAKTTEMDEKTAFVIALGLTRNRMVAESGMTEGEICETARILQQMFSEGT